MEADRDLLEVLDAWYDDMRCVSLQNPEKHLEATGHPVLLSMPTFSIWTSSRLKHGLRGLDDAWVPNWPSEIGRCWDVKPIELQSMEKLRPLCHDLCRTKLKGFAKWSDMVSLLKGRIKTLFDDFFERNKSSKHHWSSAESPMRQRLAGRWHRCSQR